MFRRAHFAEVPSGFRDVTERAGEPATHRQITDMAHRYRWAASICAGRRVLEVACGTGQGLGVLSRTARSVVACDLDQDNLEKAARAYGSTIPTRLASALELPVEKGEVDAVVLFEALYYLPDAEAFLSECRRVLAPSGVVLLSTTNPDVFDFVPSPLSQRYYGACELEPLLRSAGFRPALFGYGRSESLQLRQRLLRPFKVAARGLGLMPRTMRGKALVRRIIFGRLPIMPADLTEIDASDHEPEPIPAETPDRVHRFLYATGELGVEA